MPKISPNLEYRWPRSSDRLLKRSDDWDRSVNFSDHPLTRHAQIWAGYIRAAELLIDISNREPSERNDLIYPIVFSYRHGLEMAMKWIVSHYGVYAKVLPPEPDHNLWQLWQSCKRIFDAFAVGDQEANENVERIIKEFHGLDKTGLSFRYSANKNGALIPLPNGLIDLANMRDVMSGISRFFSGADIMLDAHASCTETF